MYDHLESVPESIHIREPEVSAFLSDVVSTLLGKPPEDRFPSARDLAGVLEEGERAAWWIERERTRPTSHHCIPRVPVRCEIGDQETCCPLEAQEIAAKLGTEPVYFIGDSKFEDMEKAVRSMIDERTGPPPPGPEVS